MNTELDNNSKLYYDTVRFTTSSEYITLITGNESLFKHEVDIETGELKSIEFNSQSNSINRDKIPFSLYIRANMQSRKMTIEFSSKLLLEDYPLLISEDTFPQALQNMERLGICILDIESITKDCKFNKLHLTKDIDMKLTENILNSLNLCTGNYRKRTWKYYEGESICFKKDVKTKDCKEELNIYNKEKEIQTTKNKAFLKMTGNAEKIISYYKNKTRFELKMESIRKIKQKLKITDISLHSVMRGNPDILLEQFDDIFTSSTNNKATDKRLIDSIGDYGLYNTLRYHNFDLKKVEQEIKDLGVYGSQSRAALSRQMKKLKQMLHTWSEQNIQSNSIIDSIRNKLADKNDKRYDEPPDIAC